MKFSAKQFFFIFFLAKHSLSIKAELKCYGGYTNVFKPTGSVISNPFTKWCGSSDSQCLKMECEDDYIKTVWVTCGDGGFSMDCTEEVKAKQSAAEFEYCFGINGKRRMNKCSACNTENCWGTTPLPAPQFRKATSAAAAFHAPIMFISMGAIGLMTAFSGMAILLIGSQFP